MNEEITYIVKNLRQVEVAADALGIDRSLKDLAHLIRDLSSNVADALEVLRDAAVTPVAVELGERATDETPDRSEGETEAEVGNEGGDGAEKAEAEKASPRKRNRVSRAEE